MNLSEILSILFISISMIENIIGIENQERILKNYEKANAFKV